MRILGTVLLQACRKAATCCSSGASAAARTSSGARATANPCVPTRNANEPLLLAQVDKKYAGSDDTVLQSTAEHCLMGIKGAPRRCSRMTTCAHLSARHGCARDGRALHPRQRGH